MLAVNKPLLLMFYSVYISAFKVANDITTTIRRAAGASRTLPPVEIDETHITQHLQTEFLEFGCVNSIKCKPMLLTKHCGIVA